jgi:membrane fusion protein (multidrug efflux system)
LQAAEALTANTSVENHPEVLAAKAQLDTAKLNLSRTVITAPVTGLVAQRNVQVGQMAGAGRPIMAVVPIQDVYVDANFKEDQLAKVRPGQTVTLTSDLYGSSVKFHGTVAGLGGGTGAAFAIIPAQNATGNWIKVVQRIPVRIALDPTELRDHPLRVGLSMKVSIDISK